MKENIKNWYSMNNNHQLDDERFYNLVIKSITDKIEKDFFQEAILEEKPNATEGEINTIYCKYELLWHFLNYYLTHRNANN